MRTHTKESQSALTPDSAIQILKEGNKRFVNNIKVNRNLLQQVNETKEGQHPFATILSCMDSRTSAELIFDQGLGDIFSIRIAGNVLNDDIVGSMEFGTKVVGTKVVVVLGHTKCGAISGACSQVELGKLTGLLKKIQPAIDQEPQPSKEEMADKNSDFVSRVTENNVRLVMKQIVNESDVIAEMEKNGEIKIIGGIYDVETGEVNFFDN